MRAVDRDIQLELHVLNPIVFTCILSVLCTFVCLSVAVASSQDMITDPSDDLSFCAKTLWYERECKSRGYSSILSCLFGDQRKKYNYNKKLCDYYGGPNDKDKDSIGFVPVETVPTSPISFQDVGPFRKGMYVKTIDFTFAASKHVKRGGLVR